MIKITKTSILVFLFSINIHAQDYSTDIVNYLNYMPESSCGEIIHHTSYSVSFCEDDKISEWAIYYMTPDKIGTTKRTNDFRRDPKAKGKDASLEDYKGSGYDRGHLVPARDMSSDIIKMSESFFMTNITPQHPSFNRGILNNLESQVRDWIYDIDTVIIITGCIDTSLQHQTIGAGKVRIPELFYKIIIDVNRMTSISFLIPNKKAEKTLFDYVCSIKDLETLSGLDFFYRLPDDIENLLEFNSSEN